MDPCLFGRRKKLHGFSLFRAPSKRSSALKHGPPSKMTYRFVAGSQRIENTDPIGRTPHWKSFGSKLDAFYEVSYLREDNKISSIDLPLINPLYGPECELSSEPTCALLDRAAWECPPSLENVLPSLGIRGKSRGSVRESGDSVERLEECSGTRACTFGELSARGMRLECTGGARGVRACAGSKCLRARGCASLCGYGCTVHPRARPSPEIT
ncbi:hypothetical protein CRG98_005908 [Punica granatum]|uniref:Uncharacterized protein n=1 Tax=Punica granatum TaxID=22663 RepID=A0A2I0KYW4_PUNGR|nr:hypothetical protein CRG98_005908 [Punica granatum]